MIKIKNYAKFLSNDQIESLISILSNKYQHLDVTIIFLKKRWHMLFFKNQKGIHARDVMGLTLRELLRGDLQAITCKESEHIFIMPITITKNKKMRDEEEQQLKIRYTKLLYHQLRHAWQKYNNPTRTKTVKCFDDYIHEWEVVDQWGAKWYQKEAIEFADKMFAEHEQEIRKILDIYRGCIRLFGR